MSDHYTGLLGPDERRTFFKRDARRYLRRLSNGNRKLARQFAAECRMCGSVEEVELRARQLVDDHRDEHNVRFDVLTILAIIQVCIAIWRFMREMGWLSEMSVAKIEQELGGD